MIKFASGRRGSLAAQEAAAALRAGATPVARFQCARGPLEARLSKGRPPPSPARPGLAWPGLERATRRRARGRPRGSPRARTHRGGRNLARTPRLRKSRGREVGNMNRESARCRGERARANKRPAGAKRGGAALLAEGGLARPNDHAGPLGSGAGAGCGQWRRKRWLAETKRAQLTSCALELGPLARRQACSPAAGAASLVRWPQASTSAGDSEIGRTWSSLVSPSDGRASWPPAGCPAKWRPAPSLVGRAGPTPAGQSRDCRRSRCKRAPPDSILVDRSCGRLDVVVGRPASLAKIMRARAPAA